MLLKWYGNYTHAHGKEIFMCIGGLMEVGISDGLRNETIFLGRGEALYIPKMVWHKVRGGTMIVMTCTDYKRTLC